MADEHFGKVLYIIPGTGRAASGLTPPYFYNYGSYFTGDSSGSSTAAPHRNTSIYKYYDSSLQTCLFSSLSSDGYFQVSPTSNALLSSNNLIDSTTKKDFVLETWWYAQNAITFNGGIFLIGSASATTKIQLTAKLSTNELVLDIHNGSATTPAYSVTSSTSVNTGTWYHIAVQGDATAGTITLFLDGTSVGSVTYDDWTATPTESHYFGANNYRSTGFGASGSYFNLNDIRCTVGTTRYTTGFTPPTQLVKTVSGTVLDDTGTGFAGEIIAVPRLFELEFDTTNYTYTNVRGLPFPQYYRTTAAANGTFSITVPDVEVDIIYLAPSGATLYNDLVDRVYPG